MGPKGESVLLEARTRVLRVVRHLALWLGLPTLLLSLLGAVRAGRSFTVLLVEIATLTVLGGLLWIDRERRPRHGGVVTTLGLFVTSTCALIQFGPLMGTGAMFMGWALLVVFFHERMKLAVLGVAAVCAGTFVLLANGWHPRGWPVLPDGAAGFARIGATMFIFTTAISFAFARLLGALKRAIDLEHEAREREATARAEHEETQKSLAESRRLEAVGQLASGAAHDFNNVMTVLASGLFALKGADKLQRQELLGELERTLDMARATTRQLLSFAKQGSSPAEHACPSESIVVLARSLTRLLPDAITVHHDVTPTPCIALSSGELEQLLLNLALNARDAMSDGGTLTLRAHPSEVGDRRGVTIVVEDTGTGLLGAAASRAGEPFFSTKRRGSGLGLSMVKRSVARGGGEIVIEGKAAEAGGGTRVQIFLPEAAGPRARTSSASETPLAVDAPVAPPASVLLLEDEPDVRRAMERMLSRASCDVTQAANVAQALAALEGKRFDLLVTDASLPDGDAGPVIRRARSLGCPVIVCSGHLDVNEVLHGVEQADFVFLQKPFVPQVLLAEVARLLIEARTVETKLRSA